MFLQEFHPENVNLKYLQNITFEERLFKLCLTMKVNIQSLMKLSYDKPLGSFFHKQVSLQEFE